MFRHASHAPSSAVADVVEAAVLPPVALVAAPATAPPALPADGTRS